MILINKIKNTKINLTMTVVRLLYFILLQNFSNALSRKYAH